VGKLGGGRGERRVVGQCPVCSRCRCHCGLLSIMPLLRTYLSLMGCLLLGFLVCRLGVMVVCVCPTLVHLLAFLMCPVAPYYSCVLVISSSS